MFLFFAALVFVLAIVRIIYESKTDKKNKKLKALEWTFAICAVAVLFVVNFGGRKAYVEEYTIPIHNVQDFRVKMTESYATWDDGYGETYIVPKESVEVEPFPDNELRIWSVSVSYEYDYWADWACVLMDFGLFGSTKTAKLVSKTYRIECPESQVVISQKSNREVKSQFF